MYDELETWYFLPFHHRESTKGDAVSYALCLLEGNVGFAC